MDNGTNGKKQKVLILIGSQKEDSPAADHYRQHALPHQEVTVRRLDSFFSGWDGTTFFVSDIRKEITLADFSVVHFAGWRNNKEMAYAIGRWLALHDIPFNGRDVLAMHPTSKIDEMTILSTQGISYPESYFTPVAKNIKTVLSVAQKDHGLCFPLIVKAIAASSGEDNFFVKDQNAFDALPLDASKRYIMQRFVPNNCDYRFLIIGGKVELVIRRTRTGDTHLNNTAKGARADILPISEISDELIDLAIKTAAAVNQLDIAGVDILVDEITGKPYILEVNKRPHMVIGAESTIPQKLQALYRHLDKLAH